MDQNGEDKREESKSIVANFNSVVSINAYQACFIVSDFKFEKSEIISGLHLRVFAQPTQIEKVKSAVHHGKIITEYYIDYLQTDYPLQKLDFVAIPDLVSDAMGNWGLITFREALLLYDEASSSNSDKQRMAQVISHELARMWFGNLGMFSNGIAKCCRIQN